MSPRVAKLDPEKPLRAARLYDELGTVRKVAAAMDVNVSTAYRYLVVAGVMPLEEKKG